MKKTSSKPSASAGADATVGFLALGCPKNIVDSETMLARIGLAGFILTDNIDRVDILVINTCGFIAPARDEALAAIRRAVAQKKKGHIKKLVVAGCLTQRLGKELLELAPGIDALVGLADRDAIDAVIKEISSAAHKQPSLLLSPAPDTPPDDRNRLLINPPHWAYLRISEGCSRQCSFCTIPFIRGKFRSKPMDLLTDEAKQLADNGAVELSLIAQDSSFYGQDTGVKNGLVKLIERLDKITPLKWIRLMYLYPAGIDDALIDAIAQNPKVLKYIDMPIQHINNQILKAMHRNDTKRNTLSLIEKLRVRICDPVLRTTVIAGFPGETAAQFQELLDFIEWAKFDALGCFPFCPEQGTAAALLSGQLPESIRKRRAEQVMKIQQPIAFARTERFIGKKLTVLVDQAGKSAGNAVGRSFAQAPHIDSLCIIQKCAAPAGAFIDAKVLARQGYDLIVEQTQTPDFAC